MKHPTANPIDVVEQGYDLESSPEDWLKALMKRVYPLLDGGLGIYSYYYDLATGLEDWFKTVQTIDVAPDGITTMRRMMRTFDPETVASFQVVPEPYETISDASRKVGVADPREHPEFRSSLMALGAKDIISLRTVEPAGRGIVFCAVQKQERILERRSKTLWAKVAAHLAAAHRLREAAAATTSTSPPIFEAVLTPTGKLEHAEGEEAKHATARESLRAAVLRQERARGRTRREDPEAATAMWTALVSGRWSLVDHFERGGRRYVVARRNEHGGPDPRALSVRERDVAQLAALGKSNKLIAYELGVSASTVATHLSTAMRKLGVKTRVELLRMLMQLARSPATT